MCVHYFIGHVKNLLFVVVVEMYKNSKFSLDPRMLDPWYADAKLDLELGNLVEIERSQD